MIIVPTDRRRLLLDAGAHRVAASTPAPPTTRTSGSRPAHLVGEENAGWKLITNQLNHERVALVLGAADRRGASNGRARVGAEHRGRPTAGA